ncbi:MAG: SusC/RagA family protein, partial [Candidatus Nephrothrix sp. EaCA]
PYYGKTEDSYFNDFYDINGDGVDDVTVPYTEDASRGGRFDPHMMAYQYNSLYKESPYYHKATPWVAGANSPIKFFETGIIKNNTISLENANENSSYRLSYTNFDQTGIMPNSKLKRDNFFFTASHDFRKNLKVTAQANYVRTSGLGRPSTGYNENIMSSFRQWWQINTDILEQRDLYFASKKNLSWNPKSPTNLNPIYWDNPYWVRYENYETDARNRIIGFTQFDWDIAKGLSLMGRAAIDTYSQLQEERRAVGSASGEFGVGRPSVTSGYSRFSQNYSETNIDGILKYHTTFGQLDLTALAGLNIRRNTDDNVFASTNGGLAVPNIYALSNSRDPQLPPEEKLLKSGINGVYGSVSLGYKGFLYLDATIRRDKSSTLP